MSATATFVIYLFLLASKLHFSRLIFSFAVPTSTKLPMLAPRTPDTFPSPSANVCCMLRQRMSVYSIELNWFNRNGFNLMPNTLIKIHNWIGTRCLLCQPIHSSFGIYSKWFISIRCEMWAYCQDPALFIPMFLEILHKYKVMSSTWYIRFFFLLARCSEVSKWHTEQLREARRRAYFDFD